MVAILVTRTYGYYCPHSKYQSINQSSTHSSHNIYSPLVSNWLHILSTC